MNDLIDRDKLIDFIMESDPEWCVNPIRPIFDYIKEMPSAQPEQRWIPVETKMPKKGTLVLITDKDGYIFIAEWFKIGFSWEKHIEWWAEDEEVFPTAWMPLPEPYRPEGGEADV